MEDQHRQRFLFSNRFFAGLALSFLALLLGYTAFSLFNYFRLSEVKSKSEGNSVTSQGVNINDPSSPALSMANFSYPRFLQSYPLFQNEKKWTDEGRYAEMAKKFEFGVNVVTAPIDQAYTLYIAERAAVNAVAKDTNDRESFDRVLRLANRILSDEAIPAEVKAYTLNTVDVLLYGHLPTTALQERLMADPSFRHFNENLNPNFTNTRAAFRQNLLEEADKLARMTSVRMKLALLEAQSYRYSLAKKNLRGSEAEKRKEHVLNLMTQAQTSLQTDIAGGMPFEEPSYLVEPLYLKSAVAAQYYYATGEEPWGNVVLLYQEAIRMAEDRLPSYVPFAKNSLAFFESERAKMESK